jgi:hypothetical protein
MLLPRIVINHEQEDIGEGVEGEVGVMGVLGKLLKVLLCEFKVLLVELGHVGILFLGLDMAAVAYVKIELQISRKE